MFSQLNINASFHTVRPPSATDTSSTGSRLGGYICHVHLGSVHDTTLTNSAANNLAIILPAILLKNSACRLRSMSKAWDSYSDRNRKWFHKAFVVTTMSFALCCRAAGSEVELRDTVGQKSSAVDPSSTARTHWQMAARKHVPLGLYIGNGFVTTIGSFTALRAYTRSPNSLEAAVTLRSVCPIHCACGAPN